MSIAEFSAVMKNQAYKDWFARASVNIARDTISSLRDTEQRSTRNSLLITKDTIYTMVNKLTGREPTQAELDSVYNNLRSVKKGRSNKSASIVLKNDNSLYFPGVTFDRITRILDVGFSGIATDKKISDFFHKGHVYGLPTNIGFRTLENISKSAVPAELKERLLIMLNELIAELERQNLATANIKDSNYFLYAKYAKSRNKYLVEMQIGSENAEAGRDAATITNAIRRYFNPKNVVEIAKNLRTRPQDQFIEELINSQGSPSYKSLVIASIIANIKGEKPSDKVYTIPSTLVAKTSIKFSNKEILAENKKQKIELKALRAKVKAMPVMEEQKSIASLETILRAKINVQVANNMGTGNAKNILNYRTGRFAQSVTIDRVLMSRQGMISVFYNYMKYPYETFSDGGEQQYPKTRDPKLLISKSIREIGASLVGNRLRAVVT